MSTSVDKILKYIFQAKKNSKIHVHAYTIVILAPNSKKMKIEFLQYHWFKKCFNLKRIGLTKFD